MAHTARRTIVTVAAGLALLLTSAAACVPTQSGGAGNAPTVSTQQPGGDSGSDDSEGADPDSAVPDSPDAGDDDTGQDNGPQDSGPDDGSDDSGPDDGSDGDGG